MKRVDNEKTAKTEYERKMLELGSKISETMASVDQGYIFSAIPNRNDDARYFSSFGTNASDYAGFWATICAIIVEARNSIPEDELRDFRKGFVPMVLLTMEKCFPMLHLEGTFCDELGENKEE